MQKLQAKFGRSCRLRLFEKSVAYVFSMPLNIPTPPASTSLFLEATQGCDGHGSFSM